MKIIQKATGNFPYFAYNNVPQGFSPYISNKSSRVFIAVPRRHPGVPSTLNYVKLEDGQDAYVNPTLHSFPNYEMNELDVSKWYSVSKNSPRRPQGFKLQKFLMMNKKYPP